MHADDGARASKYAIGGVEIIRELWGYSKVTGRSTLSWDTFRNYDRSVIVD